MRREFRRAAAEAFAGVTSIQSACYHYLTDRFSAHHRAQLVQHYHQQLDTTDCRAKYIDYVVQTALTELTYPSRDSYAWSGHQRAAFAGIPQKTWQRNQLCDYTMFIIDDIRRNAISVEVAIRHQIYSLQNDLKTGMILS